MLYLIYTLTCTRRDDIEMFRQIQFCVRGLPSVLRQPLPCLLSSFNQVRVKRIRIVHTIVAVNKIGDAKYDTGAVIKKLRHYHTDTNSANVASMGESAWLGAAIQVLMVQKKSRIRDYIIIFVQASKTSFSCHILVRHTATSTMVGTSNKRTKFS